MKRFLALLLVLTMAVSMAACAREASETIDVPMETELSVPAEAPAATDAPSVPEAAGTEGYPVTVTDQAGRSVTIHSEPRRIVSGYYISTSLLIALGQADKLVGIEARADKRPIYALSAPELLDLPSVGSAKEFDLEGCAALEPDLVILPMKLKEAADRLAELGIPVILVNPENQELLRGAGDIVAAALDCRDRAAALWSFTDSIRDVLEEKLENAEKPTVYLAGNSSFLSTAGRNMYQNDLIELAGAVNVAAEIEDNYWAGVSYEQLLSWNPDYIILASDASYTPEDVLSDPNLAGITAIEEGRVFKMPSSAEAWDSPVPGGILGSLWIAYRIHGDRVSEELCNRLVGEFYQIFYGFSYGNA